MRGEQGISFYPDAMVIGLGVGLILATGVLCWVAWRRTGWRRGAGVLELLRFLLVCLIVGTLFQPEWVETRPPAQSPTIAVLWDRSNSMATRDVVGGAGVVGGLRSRAEAIEPLVEEAVWKPVGEDVDVVFQPFSSRLEPPEEGTDLNAGLAQVLEGFSNLRGVVVLSDGDWNVGRSPVEAATSYRMKGVPVFAVGVGSGVPLPDLELASMDAPTFGVVGKAFRIPFVVRSSLGQDSEVRVDLRVNGELSITRVVRVPAMSEAQDSVTWNPAETGEFDLSMRIQGDPREMIPENNELGASIAVRQERLKVLVIESYPRWEYRYLRNALERDPGVEVACLLFHPELPKVGGGRSYIDRFPDANELSGFDVVFLGDVGVGPKELTAEQVQDLRQLVSAQASGLVFIPGRSGRHTTLSTGPLADLIPVVLDTGQGRGVGSAMPGHFSLTQSGQRSLLTRLADTDEENADIWRTLPGFHWYTGVERAKAGTDVLAVHDRDSGAFGRVPLIVTKSYGAGKVLFMGTDSVWRWREGVEDKYHYRFWGQVARWMAYQRQMVQGQSMRLFYSPDRPHADELVTFSANVLDQYGGPLNQGTVMVQAVSPKGRTQTIRLQPGEADAWGLFQGTFVPEEAGVYRLIAGCAETGASVETELSVQGWNRERRGRLARFDVLEEIVKITGGRLVQVGEEGRLLDEMASMPEPEPMVHRTRIWSHPLWGGFLILLLGIFWIGRKMIGAV